MQLVFVKTTGQMLRCTHIEGAELIEELPAAFVKQYRDELHKSVTLEGPSGQIWPVDVCRSKCSMSFKKGWHSFSIDHDLREGDIAVFKLITRAHFIVQVFDKDGCEKDLYSVRNSVALAMQNEEDAVGSSCMSQTSFHKDISLDSYKEETVFGTRQRHNFSSGGSNTCPIETSISCVRLVSDAMVAAKSYCTNYPATIILMKYSHVTHGFSLNLGKDFAKKWLPEDDTDVFLVNSAGNKWKVRWISRLAAFSAGWRRFSLDHGLQQNDVCLLELTSRTPFFFMVHMFRHG
ncbi:hypothetical protein O6H91_19G016300 [Diphasiastrum complanatum]|uniref:Uncharacterized protein n=2 Tax=Diphasiastrum complanatum TaxID=34168 RepID=A0ACC2AT12_DIPCM|nr:hypothetical protein O6H91_19G016000 [Diphasiastrum complanatum]KAJ7520662.1 hypothetical protein O6H91_19G016300 [Diphasiastrum complanatum]